MATKAKRQELDDPVSGQVFPPPAPERIPVHIKRRIVELFAQFQRISEVTATIKEEFGLVISHDVARHYEVDGSRCRCSRKLRAYHAEVRQRYIADTSQIAIAHQTHRLKVLQSLVDKATTAKEFAVAMKGLEQAAKEMGGVLTNQTKVTHEGRVEHRHLSIDDAREELAQRLAAAIDGGTLRALPVPSPDSEPTPEQG